MHPSALQVEAEKERLSWEAQLREHALLASRAEQHANGQNGQEDNSLRVAESWQPPSEASCESSPRKVAGSHHAERISESHKPLVTRPSSAP